MIQLQDIECTVINPLHIIYLNVSSNPLEPDFKELRFLTGQETTIVHKDKEFTIIAEIKFMLNSRGLVTLKYVCVDAFEFDYRKLLTAKNT